MTKNNATHKMGIPTQRLVISINAKIPIIPITTMATRSFNEIPIAAIHKNIIKNILNTLESSQPSEVYM